MWRKSFEKPVILMSWIKLNSNLQSIFNSPKTWIYLFIDLIIGFRVEFDLHVMITPFTYFTSYRLHFMSNHNSVNCNYINWSTISPTNNREFEK